MLNADLSIYLKEHKARIDKAIENIEEYKSNYFLLMMKMKLKLN